MIAEKSSDLDTLSHLRSMETVKNENIQDYDVINVSDVLEQLKELKQGLIKKSDNLDLN